jgi:hypothetical protein
MLSRRLMWERTPPGGVHVGELSASAGREEPQELLIGKPCTWEHCSRKTKGTPRAAQWQARAWEHKTIRAAIGTCRPGSNRLVVQVKMLIIKPRVGMYAFRRRTLLHEVPAKHINFKI